MPGASLHARALIHPVKQTSTRQSYVTATLLLPTCVSCAKTEDFFFFLKSLLQTDGFSDNVFPSEMVTICSLVARGGRTEDEQVQDMADRMVEYSRLCMKSKTRVSPFESMSFFPLPPDIPNPHFLFSGEASREGMYFRGGVRCLIFLLIYRLLMLFL